jgi:hypothetical protein
LTAGCISPSSPPVPYAGNMNISATSTLPVTTSSPIVTSAPGQNPQENTSLYINVNPIFHHYLGDIIVLNGTTNLPAGEMITLGISTTEFHTCLNRGVQYPGVCACCEGIGDSAAIISGGYGVNTWSWNVNTSQYGFHQGYPYVLYVSGRNGLVENSSHFSVWNMPKPNITLNVPENRLNGTALLLSGQVNTGNGPDKNLLLTVSSDSGKKVSSPVPVYRNGTGYFWNFTLKKSMITPYNFLSVNVSSATSPEIRIVRTFLYNNEPAYYPYSPYSG